MRVRILISIAFVIALIAITSPRAALGQRRSNLGSAAAPSTIETVTTTETVIFAYVSPTGDVKFNGNGYGPNEPVTINIQITSEGIISDLLIATWTVYTDAAGEFATGWVTPDPVGTYKVLGYGQLSARNAAATFYGPDANPAANLDQCANGQLGSPLICIDPNWENGNLNESKAHYFEGEVVAYRMRFINLDTAVSHTVVIEWDTTENSGGKHALDYVVSYNFSETNANPCSGVTGCDPTSFDTGSIPLDPHVAAGNDQIPGSADDITQIPGVFTLFGGTITNVSGYTVAGTYSGASQTSIAITFTTAVANPVLAWGGHISTRYDWGFDHSAISIPGAPYHMRLLDLDGAGGNQDRSLSASAVIFPATLTIIKDAQPNIAMPFSFTAGGQPNLSDFILEDDGDLNDGMIDRKTFTNLAYFGSANQVVITEAYPGKIFSVGDIVCTSDPHGGTGTNNYTFSLENRNVSVTLEEGEIVTCTFVNLVTGPTAGYAYLSGRVLRNYGQPISRALITVARMSNGEIRYAYTNSFGYYRFEELQAGEDYVVSVRAGRYTFDPASLVIGLNQDVGNFNFTALP
jgi:hypothetical protein